MNDWLDLIPGTAPLVLSIPHAGTEIPAAYAGDFRSLWLARKDADWWLPQLYDFAEEMGATIIRTHICRSIIDVNRDPSGAPLYPGMASTGLCPLTTFDGEGLYATFREPDVPGRYQAYFEPYHAAIAAELARCKHRHGRAVLYDCHSIRSRIPALFEGELPVFNIGTNEGKSCDPELAARVAGICAEGDFTHVVNGRFKGGYITRSFGRPDAGIHAIQMELACRAYMREPENPEPQNWPAEYDAEFAKPVQEILERVLESVLDWSL